jgi:hypothetical protein
MLGLFTLFASWPERLGKRQRPQPSRDWGNDDPRLLAAMACDLPHANRFTRKGK